MVATNVAQRVTSPRLLTRDRALDRRLLAFVLLLLGLVVLAALAADRGFDGAHAARVQAARQQMQPGLDSRRGNPDVRDAMKRLTR
jgi:hypothetical protein